MLNRVGAALIVLPVLIGSPPADAGKVGREFRVNTYTTKSQDSPRIAPLGDGGFIVVWNSFGQDGSEYGVYGQRYDATGARDGAEFRVNRTTTGNQHSPAVTALVGGGFVVVWTAPGPRGPNVYGQSYDATGALSSPEFHIRDYNDIKREDPSVVTYGDRWMTIIWRGSSQDDSVQNVYGQNFNRTGRPIGAGYIVNEDTPANQHEPSPGRVGSNSYVLTWSSTGQDGSKRAVYGRRITGGGRDGHEFQINTYTANSQAHPSVAGISDGGFVVAWSSYGQDGSGSGIYAQRHDQAGNRVGGEFRVNVPTTDAQSWPSVTGLADGGYVIAWQSQGQDGSGFGIYAQRYSAAGARVGGNFRVNTMTAGHQAAPSVVGLTGGGFVVVWEGADGSGKGIHGQLFGP
jgi:hypothetical protein